MIPLDQVKKLQVIESTLRVEVLPRTTTLRVQALMGPAVYTMQMPTEVWREFCRRQLDTTPDLQQGGQP